MKRTHYKNIMALIFIGTAVAHTHSQAAEQGICDLLTNAIGQGASAFNLAKLVGNLDIPQPVRELADSIRQQVDAVVNAISVGTGNVTDATRKQIDDMKAQWNALDIRTKNLIIGAIILAITAAIGATAYQMSQPEVPSRPTPPTPEVKPVQPTPSVKPAAPTRTRGRRSVGF